eukprot:6186042-Pleurochrysis_carterae.AAC.2
MPNSARDLWIRRTSLYLIYASIIRVSSNSSSKCVELHSSGDLPLHPSLWHVSASASATFAWSIIAGDPQSTLST